MNTITMNKKERSSYDYRSDGVVKVVEWQDNYVVTLYSNVPSVEPLGRVKRRVKENLKY